MKKIIAISILILISCISCKEEKKENNSPLLLPVLGAKKLNNNDTIYHTIAPFSLNLYSEFLFCYLPKYLPQNEHTTRQSAG
jgi:hypothetical protein